MKIRNFTRAPLCFFIIIAASAFGCDMNYDKQDNTKLNTMVLGGGCITTSPITMKSTTYDMDKNIISASWQVINNMSVQSSQPNMTSMYEMYGGVELEFDMDNLDKIFTNPMSIVKQTPLLTQFWALKKMASSIKAGDNGTWMDSDDTIDPLLGYFETTQVGDRYQQIVYSDFGKTPGSRIDYAVENNRKVKTYVYSAGTNKIFGDDDDILVKTTVYEYNSAGKMTKAINYSDDGITFKNVYVFTYDTSGRLKSMNSYSDEAESKTLNFGSTSSFTWSESNGTAILDIDLGFQYYNILVIPWKWDVFNVIKFHYEFNDNGTIHKMIQYKPISSSIDTCYVYKYSNSFLGMGQMNDTSDNFSDNEKTQVSQTINELLFGED
jgi:hypothetical protein